MYILKFSAVTLLFVILILLIVNLTNNSVVTGLPVHQAVHGLPGDGRHNVWPRGILKSLLYSRSTEEPTSGAVTSVTSSRFFPGDDGSLSSEVIRAAESISSSSVNRYRLSDSDQPVYNITDMNRLLDAYGLNSPCPPGHIQKYSQLVRESELAQQVANPLGYGLLRELTSKAKFLEELTSNVLKMVSRAYLFSLLFRITQ